MNTESASQIAKPGRQPRGYGRLGDQIELALSEVGEPTRYERGPIRFQRQ